jgi:EAL domain-containing protein (putative c-di-GMP-specific phosphodiesterase class I)
VRDTPQDPDDTAIVNAIISLGHSLGLMVTAEGVETADPLAHLQNPHCNEIQGFLFSPPILADGLAELLGAVNPENRLLPTA